MSVFVCVFAILVQIRIQPFLLFWMNGLHLVYLLLVWLTLSTGILFAFSSAEENSSALFTSFADLLITAQVLAVLAPVIIFIVLYLKLCPAFISTIVDETLFAQMDRDGLRKKANSLSRRSNSISNTRKSRLLKKHGSFATLQTTISM